MLIIYIILFLWSIVSFLQKRYVPFLVAYLGIMTKLFLLDASETLLIRGEDLCIAINFLLLPVAYKRNKETFNWGKNRISKWVMFFIAFYLFEFTLTVLLGNETTFNSLKVIRVSFVMLAFFLFNVIPTKDYTKFLKIALVITIFQTILFFLQFIGINLLAGSTEQDKFKELGVQYEVNIPTLTTFFVFFCLKSQSIGQYKYFLVCLFIFVVLLTFVRASILILVIGLAYYAFKIGQKKYKPVMFLGLILLIPLAMIFIEKKSEGSGGESASKDVFSVFSTSDFSRIDKNSGTFSFRMAMLAERIIYIIENPQYALLGVGTMHEDSPQTQSQFNFLIGTANEDKPQGRCMLDSGDITWAPVVLRYGLIGVFIHFMLLFLTISETRKRKDILVILTPLYIGVIINTFTGAYFESPKSLFLLALYLSMISRSNQEHNLLLA